MVNTVSRLKTIRARMILANSAIVAVLVAIGIFTSIQFDTLAERVSLKAITNNTEALLRLSHTLDSRDDAVRALRRGYGTERDEGAQVRLQATLEDIEAHVKAARVASTSEGSNASLDKVATALSELRTKLRTLDSVEDADVREAALIEIEESFADAMADVGQAELATTKAMDLRLESAGMEMRRTVRMVWAAAGLGLLIALLVARYLSRRVSIPLARLTEGVKGLAFGRGAALVVEGDDELARLASSFNQMATTITERTRNLKLVLDNVGDALVSCDRQGIVVGEPSQRALDWLGTPTPGVSLADYLAGHDAVLAETLCLGLEQINEEFFPVEVSAAQMPREMTRGGRQYLLSFRPVMEGVRFASTLAVISDVTEARANLRNEREARDVHALATQAIKAPGDFTAFCDDIHRRLDRALEPTVATFELHTIKGNAGVLGCDAFSAKVHAAESALSERGHSSSLIEEVRTEWSHLLERVRAERGDDGVEEGVLVPQTEYLQLLGLLASQRAGEGRALADSWTMHRVRTSLQRLAKAATRFASASDKRVVVEIDDGGLVLRRGRLDELWAQMVHLVKNAVAHGLESEETRLAQGKPVACRIMIRARVESNELTVSIRDDGAGIDWALLREKRGATGAVSRLDLLTAGSNAVECTELSGRGVGIRSVCTAVEDLEGRIDVESVVGRGTEFLIRVPVRGDVYVHEPSASLLPSPTFAEPGVLVVPAIAVGA